MFPRASESLIRQTRLSIGAPELLDDTRSAKHRFRFLRGENTILLTLESRTDFVRPRHLKTKKARKIARLIPQDAAASLCFGVSRNRREARRSAGRLLLLLSCDFLLRRCALLGRFRCFLSHLFFVFAAVVLTNGRCVPSAHLHLGPHCGEL